jgi:hypothetical protein
MVAGRRTGEAEIDMPGGFDAIQGAALLGYNT